mmetsp:Transcript_61396/g.165168  ORF Transcript_61396/g.165168 Transcript_61396/m.165168 type:complete len:86 (+) Transcript_61396:55-312(+)
MQVHAWKGQIRRNAWQHHVAEALAEARGTAFEGRAAAASEGGVNRPSDSWAALEDAGPCLEGADSQECVAAPCCGGLGGSQGHGI